MDWGEDAVLIFHLNAPDVTRAECVSTEGSRLCDEICRGHWVRAEDETTNNVRRTLSQLWTGAHDTGKHCISTSITSNAQMGSKQTSS